jgi:hypothetical protein
LNDHGQTKDKGSEAGKVLTPFDYLKHVSIQTVLMDDRNLYFFGQTAMGSHGKGGTEALPCSFPFCELSG